MDLNGILDQMQEIRSENNIYWMGILRLAFKLAPKEATILINQITKCDQKISKLTKQLGELK